jgi:antitoxin VapB
MITATVQIEGGTQTVRLPEGYLVEGTEVILKRIGKTVLLIPKNANPWEVFDKCLELVTDDFMRERNQPEEHQPREAMFE